MNDWNWSVVVVKLIKLVKMIKVYIMFCNGLIGKVWFDDVCVIEGEVLIKNEYDVFGNYVIVSYDEEGCKISFIYDIYGNIIFEIDEKGNKKILIYDVDNVFIDIKLVNGIFVVYKYDDNGNIIEKNVIVFGKM